MTNKNNRETDIWQKVEVSLVMNLYKQAYIGFIASFIGGTIVLAYLYHSGTNLILFSWYGFFLLVILFGLILINNFSHITLTNINLNIWRNLFIFGAFLSGLSWGLIGSSLLLPHDNSWQQILVMVILAGISAGSVPLLAPIRRAAIAFLIPALLPLIFYFLSTENQVYILFNIAITIYLIYLIVLSFKTHSVIKNSIYLQCANVSLLQNLSEAKNQLEVTNQKLMQAATHDPLTNVANRNLFEINFMNAIKRAERETKILVLFYLDLDNFKEVNDIYGHNVGDQLLLIVVSRIKNILRETDIISRLGGDELTVILDDVADLKVVAEIAERICLAVAKPINISEVEVHVHTSIGISVYPLDGTDMVTLLKVADRAMYYVKEHGGNNYHFNVLVGSA